MKLRPPDDVAAIERADGAPGAGGCALTLHDRSSAEAEAAAVGLQRLVAHGFPNYFEPAGPGAVPVGGEFPGKQLVAGEPERALRALVATPRQGDQRRTRWAKARCAARWGDWAALAAELPPGPERAVAHHLAAHPRDFAGAFEQLPADLRHGVLAAWQGALWNRIVAAWLGRRLGPAAVAVTMPGQRLVRWDVPSPALAAEMDRTAVSLPRHDADYQGEWRELAADVLGSEGVTVEGMFGRRLHATTLAEGARPIRVCPRDAVAEPPVPDAASPARVAVTLRFALPPGSSPAMLARCLGLGTKHRAAPSPVGPRRER